MNETAFGAIGGTVIGDAGPVSLAEARALAAFYAAEAVQESGRWSSLCRARAANLAAAAEAAAGWRRAAGWADPCAADGP